MVFNRDMAVEGYTRDLDQQSLIAGIQGGWLQTKEQFDKRYRQQAAAALARKRNSFYNADYYYLSE